MSYVYSKVDDLEDTDKVGSKQCVALVQYYAQLPQTANWKEGLKVLGNLATAKGTAIATFVNGKYESHSTGNHAAFYISQDAGGIWVMDQWANDTTKPKVSKRYLRKKGTSTNGGYIDPSNNAEAFSAIE
jgi:hypothetical protein